MEGGFQLLILIIALISILSSVLKKYKQAESRRLQPKPSGGTEGEEASSESYTPREEPSPPPLPPLLQRLREEMERMTPPPEAPAEETVWERPAEETTWEQPAPEEQAEEEQPSPAPSVPLEPVPQVPRRRRRSPLGRLTPDTFVRGIVLSEILGPCRAQRGYERSRPV